MLRRNLDEAQSGLKTFFPNEFSIKTHPINSLIQGGKIVYAFLGSNKFKWLHAVMVILYKDQRN